MASARAARFQRLPITAVKEAGVLRVKRSNGGLVSRLLQVARTWPLVWYGWNGMASAESIKSGKRRLVLGVDRLDYTKGFVEGLPA